MIANVLSFAMPSQLLVRNLDERIVEALKARAAKHGRSVEEEHRRILKRVLCPTPKLDLKRVLSEMPNVGEDEDFISPRVIEDREVDL